MAARKTSRKIRTAQEFTSVASAMRALQPPPSSSRGIYGWDLDAIRNARDLQMLGSFYEPSRLAESMRTDDALTHYRIPGGTTYMLYGEAGQAQCRIVMDQE